jgi:hypothetical protein
MDEVEVPRLGPGAKSSPRAECVMIHIDSTSPRQSALPDSFSQELGKQSSLRINIDSLDILGRTKGRPSSNDEKWQQCTSNSV